jgi:hypothetical protein
VPLHEDSGNRAVGLVNGLVEEIHEALLARSLGHGLQHEAHILTDERLARLVDAIEKLVEALTGDVRKRLANGLADHRPPPNELQIGSVGELEDVVLTAQDGDEARGLLEQQTQAPPFGIERGVDFLDGLRPPEKVAFRLLPRRRADRLTQPVELGDVHRMLQDQSNLSVFIEQGCMRGAPVALLETSVRSRNVVMDQRQVIRCALADHALEGVP